MKITLLCSGNGGNLRALKVFVDYLAEMFDLRISLSCLVDRPCGAADFANHNGIPCQMLSHPRGDSSNFIMTLKQEMPDLILTNIHKILDDSYVTIFGNVSFNLHYSLLPKYAGEIGENPIRFAYILDEFLGTTLHLVNRIVDSGEILIQSRVKSSDVKSFQDALNVCFTLGTLQIISLICSKFNLRPKELELEEVESIFGIQTESLGKLWAPRYSISNEFFNL